MKQLHPIMFAGTGSDVGKSIVAAAFCRIFKQDGYQPAPFKAQNMALNSYATPEGLEIGRAQAVQAEAAGIACHTDMNPLLLKPQSDHTSQVILNGKPVGNKHAYDYWRRQGAGDIDFRAEVCKAFDRLAARYNPIVMEGAGSISEINLRATDLVNLPMARHAKADVILVGDIDRGGVFASVYGSIALQTPEDKALIKGIIINKFRGDMRLFEEGRRMLEEICGVPVLGVIPYFKDIHIEEEDSVALAQKSFQLQQDKVNIAVIMTIPTSMRWNKTRAYIFFILITWRIFRRRISSFCLVLNRPCTISMNCVGTVVHKLSSRLIVKALPYWVSVADIS